MPPSPAAPTEREPFYAGDAGGDTTESATDSDHDTDTNHSGANRRQRQRKRVKQGARPSTYVARRLEQQSLVEELRLLEARLDYLRVKVGLPSTEEQRALAQMQTQNVNVEETIHDNVLKMARFQSLLALHLNAIPVDPMSTYIHLSHDIGERHATLRAMRARKLRHADELVADRLGCIDPLRPYSSEERFLTTNGSHRCKRFDVQQFDGVTVKQLYEALVHYPSHVDTSLLTSLGQLAIQETVEIVDATTWNHRLLSTTGSGYIQELNSVGFAQLVNDARGIILCDAVDVDERHPYKPTERVRKDITAALLIEAMPRDGLRPSVVVVRRCLFVTIHKPQFEIPHQIMEEVCANLTTWGTVMNEYLRSRTVAPS